MKKNMKVLLVEDLPSDAELAERELRKQFPSFTITLVDTKEDFIHALNTTDYDLIISDYKMPSFDGLTALRITREMVPYTPFIILTGSMNEDTAVECMKTGADDYVIKEHIKRLNSAALKAIEKKRIELERVQQRKEYKQLIDGMIETAFVIDFNAKFIEVNQAAVNVLGYSREELLKMGPADIDPHLSSKDITELVKGMKTDEHQFFETQHQTKSGKIIPVEISSSNVMYKGKPVILSVVRDITKRKQTEERIQKELKEKNVLLREIHHRTKNNLQTICSLLQLQQDTIKTKGDAIKSFEVSQDRIQAMAKAYEILLQAEYMSKVTIGNYILSLAKQLKRNYDIHNKITLSSTMEEIEFNTEKLSKLGLVMNEVLTNAMKYAFRDRNKGSIHISVKDAGDYVEFIVEDDGVGIPKEIDIHHPTSLGLSLVDMLISEFNGKYSIKRNKGTKFTLRIPKHQDESDE